VVFGYSTNAFVKFSLFARLGFKGIEIMGDRPHLYPPDFDMNTLARLKEVIEQNQLKITNINSFTLFAVGDTYLPSWIESDERRRNIRIRHTLDSLKVANYLGCKNISVPPGGPLNNMSGDEAFALFHEGLSRVTSLAEELEIKILVEPEPDLLMENTREFKTFIKDVKSAVIGLNFDIGHEDLFEWIGHVHIEDIAPNRTHNHLITGQGAIRFKEIFETMVRLGYKGDISLELYPYVDRPEEAGRESLEYLKPIFRETGLRIDI
jgi:sugar phosphate isomerase/epimerase